ncbi:hypothetical protein ACIPJQ_21370 [Streptomyces griseoviridis]|uniref:hypothetical protein n=1 Tax=Streptomyces griseoviridis TaxID=45398 RepID=UPI003451D94A
MDDDLITERRSVTFPQVFGYLRHVTGGAPRHTALVDCLTENCDPHELTLCDVFTERDATVIIRSPPSSVCSTRSTSQMPTGPWFRPSATSARRASVPGLRLLKVGDGWDVVRTSAEIGLLAPACLRGTGISVGPVLHDKPNGRLYHAVPTDSAASWEDLPVRHLSTNSWLVAPGWNGSTTGSADGASCLTTTPSPTRTPSAPRSSTRTSPRPTTKRIPTPASGTRAHAPSTPTARGHL